MGEFDSGLLNQFNGIRESHVKIYFQKHGHLLKWKPSDSILDIGCGTGDLSYNYIYPLLHEDFKEFICTDISKKMLQSAEKQFKGKPKVHFDVLDISSDLQDEMQGKFNHIFSLYCLMWVANQRKAFENIYNLLSPGGACFLLIVERHLVMEVIFELLERPRWKKFVPVWQEVYPYPYRNLANPVKTIKDMMKSIGYVNFKVYREKGTFAFRNKEEFLGFLKALPNPLAQMTAKEQEDYLKEAVDLGFSNKVICDSEDKVTGHFLVVYGEK